MHSGATCRPANAAGCSAVAHDGHRTLHDTHAVLFRRKHGNHSRAACFAFTGSMNTHANRALLNPKHASSTTFISSRCKVHRRAGGCEVRAQRDTRKQGVGPDRGEAKRPKRAARATPVKVIRDLSIRQCYGCGADLQKQDGKFAGYLPPDKYDLKKLHNQLKSTLCTRCSDLSNGAMLNMVAGQAHAPSAALGLITADQLRDQLLPLQDQKALVVQVVDILDFNGTIMNRVRELVRNNPIILMVTKSDLLPKGTSGREVLAWVQARAEGRRLTVAGIILVSSRTGDGMEAAVGAVLRERRGRPVYAIGAANAGKSSFVSAFLKRLSETDIQASMASRYLPVASAMPGTTLGMIPIQAFGPKEKALYDTAGVLLHHRLNALLNEDELKAVNPRRRLNPYTPRLPEHLSEGGGPQGLTYLWGAVVRIDVLEAAPSTRLAFVGPPGVRIKLITTKEADGATDAAGNFMPTEEEGEALFGLATVQHMGGLKVVREVELDATVDSDADADLAAPVADLAVSGLGGWVGVFSKPQGGTGAALIRLRVWAPAGVEIFLRPPMPIKWNTFL